MALPVAHPHRPAALLLVRSPGPSDQGLVGGRPPDRKMLSNEMTAAKILSIMMESSVIKVRTSRIVRDRRDFPFPTVALFDLTCKRLILSL